MLVKELPQSGDRAAGTHAHHHRIELAAHLAQDFGTGIDAVCPGIVRIRELVDEKRVGNLGGQTLGVILVILGMSFLHVRARQPHVDAHRAYMPNLVGAHLVGDNQDKLVTLLRRDQAEA